SAGLSADPKLAVGEGPTWYWVMSTTTSLETVAERARRKSGGEGGLGATMREVSFCLLVSFGVFVLSGEVLCRDGLSALGEVEPKKARTDFSSCASVSSSRFL